MVLGDDGGAGQSFALLTTWKQMFTEGLVSCQVVERKIEGKDLGVYAI